MQRELRSKLHVIDEAMDVNMIKEGNSEMKEILGFGIDNLFSGSLKAIKTYTGEKYEIWEMEDSVLQSISDMTEDEFIKICPDGWWRSSTGSILTDDIEEFIINGQKINAWCHKIHDEFFHNNYSDLSDYLCNHVGVSQPKNICACAVDLAKINELTMAELFEKYEGCLKTYEDINSSINS